MTKLIYTALLVLFLAPLTFAEDPKAETPDTDVPVAEVQNADAPEEATAPEADVESADAPEAVKPECEKILAEVKAAKAVHHADYKAKGDAFFNWRKYNKQLHSISYEATDKPLADSVEKCNEGDYLGKAFCKGALKEYDKISAKEKPAKEQLDAAEAKSNKSRTNYNLLLAEAHKMDCLVNQ